MLRALSGRTHRVLTAVARGTRPAHAGSRCSVSRVRFAALPPRAIDAYVASGEPFGKAGAYAIQGAHGGLDRAHRRQLLRHHGPAAVRDRAAAARGRRGACA